MHQGKHFPFALFEPHHFGFLIVLVSQIVLNLKSKHPREVFHLSLCQSVLGMGRKSGIDHPFYFIMASRNWAALSALSAWDLIFRGKVAIPLMISHAMNGLMTPPTEWPLISVVGPGPDVNPEWPRPRHRRALPNIWSANGSHNGSQFNGACCNRCGKRRGHGQFGPCPIGNGGDFPDIGKAQDGITRTFYMNQFRLGVNAFLMDS